MLPSDSCVITVEKIPKVEVFLRTFQRLDYRLQLCISTFAFTLFFLSFQRELCKPNHKNYLQNTGRYKISSLGKSAAGTRNNNNWACSNLPSQEITSTRISSRTNSEHDTGAKKKSRNVLLSCFISRSSISCHVERGGIPMCVTCQR